jgi:hypothetical protein
MQHINLEHQFIPRCWDLFQDAFSIKHKCFGSVYDFCALPDSGVFLMQCCVVDAHCQHN